MKTDCKHKHFSVLCYNRIGYGQCLDCNKEINLNILFNGLITRIETVIQKYEKQTKWRKNICTEKK